MNRYAVVGPTSPPFKHSDDSAYVSKTPAMNTSSDECSHKPPIKKRKRWNKQEDDMEAEDGPESALSPLHNNNRKKVCAFEVVAPQLVNPASVYGLRTCAREREVDILNDYLLTEEDLAGDKEDTTFISFTLEDFVVYTAHDYIAPKDSSKNAIIDSHPFKYPYEMIRLSALNITSHISYVLVDGFLVSESGERRYVERMKVDSLAVDYSGTFQSPTVWLQSRANSELRLRKAPEEKDPLEKAREKVWYALGAPAPSYARYYEPFLWLATFGVHFFMFLEDTNGDVLLSDFRKGGFATWLENRVQCHEDKDEVEPYYRSWLARVADPEDFAIHVAAHKDWLWNQLFGLYTDPKDRLRNLTLWHEIHTLSAIKPAYSGPHENLTVVTPYVYSVFESMYGKHLKKVLPIPEAPEKLPGAAVKSLRDRADEPYIPQVGDVVAVLPDEGGTWSRRQQRLRDVSVEGSCAARWTEEHWFGWVTKIRGGDELSIVWLYKPSDTVLSGGHYPWANELFFSDHCNCSSDSEPLLLEEVVGKVDVLFHPKPDQMPNAEFFVRQKYRTDDPAFFTLEECDLKIGRCPCKEINLHPFVKVKRDYMIGDTVLYSPRRAKLLEPAVIVGFDDMDMSVTLRCFQRLETAREHIGDIAPNEIMFTHQFESVHPQRISRRCFVRVFNEGDCIEAPYDRDGIGDCFFIRLEVTEDGQNLPLRRTLTDSELRQGFRLGDTIPKPVLRGMDLFCGGGNFGRGLEEGGVVSMKYAVDLDHAPLHSYRANVRDLNDTKLYLGSINNYLEDAIRGNFSEDKGIPRGDQVDFISAGSPCQGFSVANSNKGSESAVRKQSLVCSLATAIDVYRPKYAVLENVRGIAGPRKGKYGKEENTFTTMLCAIVGMGYQCESFLCDSWSYGNCQSRTRLILAISKEGYAPLQRPPRSHNHNFKQQGGKLYKAPNGQSFGFREVDGLCPFRFPSISSPRAWGRLPDIGDGHVNLSIKYPDHIAVFNNDTTIRLLMAHVPRFSHCNSWRTAIDSGRLHHVLWAYVQAGEKLKPDCRTFSRITRDGLCRTVTTTPTPQCSRTGRWVHPEANRLITVHEARIAQGYPDTDVLVGTPKHRLHVIGNSVARGVSLALGIALREAYLGSIGVE